MVCSEQGVLAGNPSTFRRPCGRSHTWSAPRGVLDPAVLTSSTTEESYADRFTECFMAAAPGIIATTMLNAYCDAHERYVFPLAEEMRKGYEYIHAQGFILQLDAPDLAIERTFSFQDTSTPEFRQIVAMYVVALNLDSRNIPLADILPLLYQAKVGALSLEMANRCRQHEYKALKTYPLPDSMLLTPGVIDATANDVEHQEVIADRVCQVVEAVGDRSRALAGTECGFGTFPGWGMVARDVVWAKLQVCSEGARLATQPVWQGGSLRTADG